MLNNVAIAVVCAAIAAVLVFELAWFSLEILQGSSFPRVEQDNESAEAMASSTLAMSLLFGVLTLVWLVLQLASLFRCRTSRALAFLRPAAAAGLVLTLCYLCEHWPRYPHAPRVYSRDLYLFLCLATLAAALLTVRKVDSSSEDILCREQSEEWKGWMQVMFLLYHHCHATEIYNPIRVMVSSYVWLTGFGNFLFFARKADFGAVRLAQMMWRLNAAVVFLCWTMDTPYILYYVCALHSFYFLLTYATMAACHSWNSSPKLLFCKIMFSAVLAWVIWDLPWSGFQLIFGNCLSSRPQLGAQQGSLYEWYFRSGLDHFSSLIGMVFAAALAVTGYPLRTRKASGIPVLFWVVPLSAGAVWSWIILPMQKLDYNSWHPYTSFVPILLYTYLRNSTHMLRTHYLWFFQAVGRTSLESYLLQHHIWLTSNGKSQLTLIPGYPLLNLLLATGLFLAASQVLFHATLCTRELLLPESPRSCAQRGGALLAAVLLSFWHAGWLQARSAGPSAVLSSIAVVAAAVVSALLLSEEDRCDKWSAEGGKAIRSPTAATREVESLHSSKKRDLHLQVAGYSQDEEQQPDFAPEGHELEFLHGCRRYAVDSSMAPQYRRLPVMVVMTVTFVFVTVSESSSYNREPELSGQTVGPHDKPELPAAVLGSCRGSEGGGETRVPLPRGGKLGFTNIRACCEAAALGEWRQKDASCRLQPAIRSDNEKPRPGCSLFVSPRPSWHWLPTPAQCRFGARELKSRLCGGAGEEKLPQLVLAGDSVMRQVFVALSQLLEAEEPPTVLAGGPNATLKHSDQVFFIRPCDGKHEGGQQSRGNVTFLWRPYVDDLVGVAADASMRRQPLVLGGGLWDALHKRDVPAYRAGIVRLRQALVKREAPVLWLRTTAVNDPALSSPEKRAFMTDEKVSPYREAALEILRPVVTQLIDAYEATAPVRPWAADGVHYPQDVQVVLGELVVRTLSAALPPPPRDPTAVGRPAVGLGHAWRGLAVLVLLATLLLASAA
ncbi:unnamed protein product [Polarella glacialis]|uniref:Cas1p 10 TM acyl transferase domain-containing protein n=1 Tax=Polarella glacialis TaxID=89957 RepID=A0A813GW72_POLGL|nr:unnamed protein product [Polarella glacialis]